MYAPFPLICFGRGRQNCLPCVHRMFQRWKSSIKRFTVFYHSLGSWAKRFSSSWKKFFARVVKTALNVSLSIKNFTGKKLLKVFCFSQSFRTLSEYFQPSGIKLWTRLSKLHCSFLHDALRWNNFPEENQYCHLFRISSEKYFGPSANKLSTGLSKLHSTSPREHFGEELSERFSLII